ncbi:cation-translocating P-type ATPase [Stakelama tenebrarum]|uniref:HAD-IC family P-type ATPase n=1 Tax=Stakelama tenebrarum TaxID=2711215 RepID=A0A6G6Y498_9SPHN|nr:HAD-IC family P-type ATPase [Sphingosinithalassobacter tenebrarum]QIG79396.1 HAD-IC family P-type ATPase [Sphingosinithalassobacter tenebrarum]
MTERGDDARPWHALSAEASLAAVESTAAGLTVAQVRERLDRYGPNRLPEARPPSILMLFLSQFRSPLIYLLLAAALVSLFVGDATDAAFIMAVLLLNAVIGTLQEGRAGASARALETLVHRQARVRREGAVLEVDASDVVPGDIVLIESGAAVPADLRLIETSGLTVDEALLTGEAMPVTKEADVQVAADAGVADRATMLHAGTIVTQGRAAGVVVATGLETALGAIAASLHATPPEPPPLLRYLARLARQIAVAVSVLIVLLAIALILRGASVDEVFLLAVALAVSAIPEGLPVAVTVALATATQRMARRNVVVRTLPSVEGLGSCTLIATDKTGTLTINQLTVEAALPAGRATTRRGDWAQGADDAPLQLLARTAAACNEAQLKADGSGVGDSVDLALLRFAAELGIAPPASGAVAAMHPYEPVNAFSSVALEEDDGLVIHAKGAIERIAAMCDAPDPELIAAAEAMAADGYRVIALARGSATDCTHLDCPAGLTLIGCLALFDPLRPEAVEAIGQCREAGIAVRMVTGDHPATALTIARQIGLAASSEQVLTGREIAALADDPEACAARIRDAHVYARTDPEQKLQIVRTLSESGHVVAVTGDGVNDAPALQAAAIGVAMGRSGTDVARAAADLLLTDDNFASIVGGVEEGRISYANIRKIAIYLLGTGIAELLMFLGSVALGLPMPLTAVQLLWVNIVTEGVQHVTLGISRGDGDELAQHPRARSARLIDADALWRMVPPALVMAAVAIWQLDNALASGATLAEAQNGVMLCVVLFQNVFLLSIRSLRHPVWADPFTRNPWLFAGIAGALALQFLAMTWSPLQAVLGTQIPDGDVMLHAGIGAVATLIMSEIVKAVRTRKTA